MSTLNVTRSLVSHTNPTETQFDTMRTYLLNFFNAASLDSDNLKNGTLAYTDLTMLDDDESFGWADCQFYYDSGDDAMIFENTVGDFVWGVLDADLDILEKMRFRDDGMLEVSTLELNTAKGSHAVNFQWLLSRYRKPRLVYSSDDIVTVEANGPDGNTYVYGRDRLWKIYDTTCSLAADANGETSGDTGTAVSGRLAGESRVANRWYYIYAVEVQYGTQADGANAILVATVTSPLTSNISTLNTAFGTGKWVYMGVVRNGYNDGTNTNIIMRFNYDENGYLRFTNATGSQGMGMTLASGTASTNLEYTLDLTNNDADSIPVVATRAIFSGHRSSHGMEFHYRNISTDENHMIVTSCYHVSSLSSLSAIVRMEVPVLDGYKLVVVIGNASTNRRITLVGFLDTLV